VELRKGQREQKLEETQVSGIKQSAASERGKAKGHSRGREEGKRGDAVNGMGTGKPMSSWGKGLWRVY